MTVKEYQRITVQYVLLLQGILPYAAYSGIKELFVPAEKLEEAKKEAEELPSVEISTVCLRSFILHEPHVHCQVHT